MTNYRSLYQCKNDGTKSMCIDEFGFITDSRKNILKNERALKTAWYEVIDCYGKDMKKFRTAIQRKGLLQMGIPLSLKGRIWKCLLISPHANDSWELSTLGFMWYLETSKNQHVCSSKLSKRYQKLALQESPYEYQIHVDIQRTFRRHLLFYKTFGRGQCELFNVLMAFASRFKKIGYCQGLSDIGAILLMYFQENEAFEMMESLIRRNNLEGLFDQNLTNVPKLLNAQRTLFVAVIPDIVFHLERNSDNFSLSMIGWYLTLFARFDIRLTLRAWDYLMFYGFNVLMYFSASILKYHEKRILECTDERLIQLIGRLDESEIDECVVVDTVAKFLRETNYKHVKHGSGNCLD